MTPNRLRWGALAWLLTLQFFVVEAIAQSRYEGSYSRVDDVISDLGASDSAAHQLMNASFVLQAALILGGVVLLRPVLLRAAAQVAPVLLGAAAFGVLLVGVFPTDGNSLVHAIGALDGVVVKRLALDGLECLLALRLAAAAERHAGEQSDEPDCESDLRTHGRA